jgi:formiminotetrahydrofolate cyclodeaminase
MALEVSSRHENVAANRRRLGRLLKAAKTISGKLLGLADEDVAVFNAYLESRWLLSRNEREQAKRERVLDLLLRKATQVPLKIARTAVAGLSLCADASQLIYGEVAADFYAAALLLNACASIGLGSARSNLTRADRESTYYAKAISEANELERQAPELLNRALARAPSSQLSRQASIA